VGGKVEQGANQETEGYDGDFQGSLLRDDAGGKGPEMSIGRIDAVHSNLALHFRYRRGGDLTYP
jgi:hypothetical protein